MGPVTLLLRAGRSAGNPVSASNLIVDASSLSGNATLHKIAIGQDAGSLDEDPGAAGTPVSPSPSSSPSGSIAPVAGSSR